MNEKEKTKLIITGPCFNPAEDGFWKSKLVNNELTEVSWKNAAIKYLDHKKS